MAALLRNATPASGDYLFNSLFCISQFHAELAENAESQRSALPLVDWQSLPTLTSAAQRSLRALRDPGNCSDVSRLANIEASVALRSKAALMKRLLNDLLVVEA